MAKSAASLAAKRFERYYADSPSDNRNSAQRDRDRILYTSAFRRLAGVTQVVSAREGHVFHNRLTHSLEVAQFARRTAEKLIRDQGALAEKLGVDPDITEAAALAHDIGHPPFGHIAEDELDKLLVADGVKDGFDGNAQSFRIVNLLALRRSSPPGLNLTRATLNAILKYPWFRGTAGRKEKKWGAYHSEQHIFEWARQPLSAGDERRTAEAELMNWADDVTYAVHDVEDFYRAGMIPLDRVATDRAERSRFLAFAELQFGGTSTEWRDMQKAFRELITMIPVREQYSSSHRMRSSLRTLTAGLISRYISAIQLRIPVNATESTVVLDPERNNEVWALKQLAWYYVIKRPGLATQQYGQRKVIRTLYEMHTESAVKRRDFTIFPAGFREALEDLSGPQREFEANARRIVVDLIAGMTEKQAINMFHRLTGVSLGSVLDHLVP
ncbi:MAG TPA: dNTP triphosphohydrolase [Terriglobales bacterium]|nr:dNTP triphosphohydrolase [Terriglobales bacterium]